MIDAIKIAPGLQELLRQLQAGGNVDVNQPIASKRSPALVLPDNDLPLNLVYLALVRYGRGPNAVYTPDRLKIIESLLSRGTKPNLKIKLGNTEPLLFSVIRCEELDILKLLLKYKDETFTQPHDRYTPYAYIQVAGILTAAKQASIIQAFEAAGINI